MSIVSICPQLHTHRTPVFERASQEKEFAFGIHSSAPDIRRVPSVTDLSALVLRDYSEVGCASNYSVIAFENDSEYVLFIPLFRLQSIRDSPVQILPRP